MSYARIAERAHCCEVICPMCAAAPRVATVATRMELQGRFYWVHTIHPEHRHRVPPSWNVDTQARAECLARAIHEDAFAPDARRHQPDGQDARSSSDGARPRDLKNPAAGGPQARLSTSSDGGEAR